MSAAFLQQKVSIPNNPAELGSGYTIRDSVERGRGCFSTRDIDDNAHILTSDEPVAHTINRVYKKEVCAWCFAYDRGKTWPLSCDSLCDSSTKQAVKIAWFCSTSCADTWSCSHTMSARKAMAEIELFLREISQIRVLERPNNDGGSNLLDIEQLWKKTEALACRIREARSAVPPTPAQRRLLRKEKDLLRARYDADFSNVAPLFLSAAITRDSETSPHRWTALKSLVPSFITYTRVPWGKAVLQAHCDAYLLLQMVLPLDLLPLCDFNAVITLVTREATNAFSLLMGGDDSEYVGYGVWTEASFFNHSCTPNMKKRREGRAYIFESAGKIAEGEELCISYIGYGEDLEISVDERRRKLMHGWGFWCLCQRCVEESALG